MKAESKKRSNVMIIYNMFRPGEPERAQDLITFSSFSFSRGWPRDRFIFRDCIYLERRRRKEEEEGAPSKGIYNMSISEQRLFSPCCFSVGRENWDSPNDRRRKPLAPFCCLLSMGWFPLLLSGHSREQRGIWYLSIKVTKRILDLATP